MKKLAIIISAALSLSAVAGGNNKPKNPTPPLIPPGLNKPKPPVVTPTDPITEVDVNVDVDQNQDQTVNIGDTSNTNTNNNNAIIESGAIQSQHHYNSQYSNIHSSTFNDRIQHTTPSFGKNCVGTACQATSSFFITGSRDEVTGNSINIGVAIPFGGGSSTVTRSMQYESQKLRDRNRQDRERHQAEMALLCMQLHELTRISKGKSPELWNRCYSYIPHDHHIESGQARPHKDYTERQVSPHANARKGLKRPPLTTKKR